ncbi:MFS transporter [Actinomarinicola tropica]|uniref:MFS transporter n=1 Tax=Actinomarinicola tropica TaxID=2789776 RepID=A0A5Q2RIB6_9ACTN|nr:MFS transporter [Actinomarinicola tropica]QGG96608.1 MFS transporter [Actinomarinicola tropica]
MSEDCSKGVTPARGLGSRFWRIAASAGASNLADGVFKLALPLAAITFTRSPTAVAGLELVRTLPWLLFALPVGALTDRWDRRHTMIGANLVRTASVVALAVVLQSGGGSIAALYLVAAGTGVAEVFYDTANQSILPNLVRRDQLARANGRLGAIELGAQQFVGPPLAGVLVGLAVAAAFWITTGLWLVAVAALWALRGSFTPVRASTRTSLRADIGEGLRFLVDRPLLRTMALMVGVANLASSATGAVLVLFAVGEDSVLGLDQAAIGLLVLTAAAGSIAAAFVADRLASLLGRARTLTVTVVGMVAFVATPAVTDQVWVIGAAMFAGGAMIMVWNIITVSFRQAVTPDHLLGRLNSVYRLLAWGTMPLGAAAGGLIAQSFGLRAVFASMGVLTAALFIPDRSITDAALDAADRQLSRAPT